MGTWLYNAGQPCCGDISNCGVYCRSCIDGSNATSPPIWSRKGTVTDDNGVHDLQYSDAHDYWYTKYIVYETDFLGESTEVWEGEGPKYKVASGQTIYRYIFRCNSTFDLYSEYNFFLTMLWAEGVAYSTQADADAQTNGTAVFLENSKIIKDNLIPLPSTFNDGVDGKGISSKQISATGCLGPVFADFSGPPTGDGVVTSPGPISTGASILILEANQAYCCGVWCNPCRSYVRTYGTLTDENGTHDLSININRWNTDILESMTDYIVDGDHSYTSGTIPYFYQFFCHPVTNEYQLWLCFVLSTLDTHENDPESIPDWTSGYYSPSTSAETYDLSVVSGSITHSSCSPLSITFTFDDNSQYYIAATSAESGPGEFTTGNVPFAGIFDLRSPDPIEVPFKPPLPAHSATINLGGYRPSGAVRCGKTSYPDPTSPVSFPIADKDLTLSWKNTLLGDGSMTLHAPGEGSQNWFGDECVSVAPVIPDGYADAGSPAMVLFGMSATNILSLRFTILPQGDCPLLNDMDWVNTSINFQSLFIELEFPIDPLSVSNRIVDYVFEPLYMKWIPDGGVDGARQFLVDAGYTEFVVTL